MVGGNGRDHATRLARYCHIFSSAVHEVLEAQLLREVCRQPLSVSQLHLLKLITLNGLHQVGEAADFLGVSAPAATRNIEKLVQLGLLRRRPSRRDRRVQLLAVSAKGRQLVRRYERHKDECLRRVLEGFGDDEIEQFTQLLRRFAVGLFSARPVEGGFCLRCAAHIEKDCPVGQLQGGCPYERLRRTHVADAASRGGG
jgi:DNA-binding MarR family transcriptional regulator